MARFRVENLLNKNVTTKLGVSNYKTNDVTGERLTPHLMMRKALDIFERRPFIHAGINDMISFVSGKGFFAKIPAGSNNKNGLKFAQSWIDQRIENLQIVKYQIILNYLVAGNAYLEKVFKLDGTLDNIFAIYDSSRIYYNNMEEASSENYWLFRTADDITNIMWRGKKIAITTYEPYKYSPSSNYFDEAIKAFNLPKKKLCHLKVPYTMDGFYGYSFIMATLDDEEAINKIIRNIILISSNKAVGKKIIGFWEDGGGNRTIPETDIENLQDQLDFDVGSNLVVNKKFQVEDLAHNGTYDTLIPEIEYLTKDAGSGLTPSYMTPWNSDVNRATAEQARTPFIVRIEKIKDHIEKFFTTVIIEELKKEKPQLMKDVEIEFGDTQYFSIEERKEFFSELYNSNIITMNQYLSKIDMEPLEGGDIYARDREAIFDSKYQTLGNDNFDSPGAGDSSRYEKLKPTYFREAKNISNNELYDYEFDDEESDTLKHTKKHMVDMSDEIGQALKKSLGD